MCEYIFLIWNIIYSILWKSVGKMNLFAIVCGIAFVCAKILANFFRSLQQIIELFSKSSVCLGQQYSNAR